LSCGSHEARVNQNIKRESRGKIKEEKQTNKDKRGKEYTELESELQEALCQVLRLETHV
jgi:hypothetical protein